MEIPGGNCSLGAKDLGKTKGINKESYARRWDTVEYVEGRNCLLCEHFMLGKGNSLTEEMEMSLTVSTMCMHRLARG